jgi:hypothetical protein
MSKTLRSTASIGGPAGSRADSRPDACEQFESEALHAAPAFDRRATRGETDRGDALALFAQEEASEVAARITAGGDDAFGAFLSEETVTDTLGPGPVLHGAHRRWTSWQVTGGVAAAASLILLVVAGWLRTGGSLDLVATLPDPHASVAMDVGPPSADTPAGTGAPAERDVMVEAGTPVDRGPIADRSARSFARRDGSAAVAGDGRAVDSPPAAGLEPAAPEGVRAAVELLEARSLGTEPAPGPRLVGPTAGVLASRRAEESRPARPRRADPLALVADAPVATRADAAGAAGLPAITPPTVDVAPSGDEERIQQLLERFKTAYERLDPRAAQAVWPTVDVRALERAFGSLAAQEIAFEDCDLAITGGRARATCQGQGTYVPKVGDRAPRTLRREWAFELERVSSDWRIAHTEAR